MHRLLLPLLLTACAPRATGLHARGLEPAGSTAAALQEVLAPRRVALLVGIDAYADPGFPDLAHARADALSLGEVLSQDDAGFDEVLVLADEGGIARADLLGALRRVTTGLGRDDELVVFFAGHGTRAATPSGPHRFLLTSDATPADVPGTGLDLEVLLDFVLALPPLRKGVIVDACFDGGGRSVVRPGSRGATEASLPVPTHREAVLGPGDVQVFATTPGRPSLEDDRVGHGVYTWYLLEALGWGFREADRNRDGVLTLWEAHDHARGAVIEHTDGVQIPEALLRTVGEADVVLRGRGEARRARDDALLYLYGDTELEGASLIVDGRSRGALPGTLPVDAGRHHVEVLDADGERLARGFVELSGGRSYRVDDVIRRVDRRRGLILPRAVFVSAPPLREALGAGGVGLEIAGAGAVRTGAHDSLHLGLHVGSAATLPPVRTRPLLWGGVHAVWRDEVDALRWSLGWSATAWWLPPGEAALGDPLDQPQAAGWAWFATGPQASLGVELGQGWSLEASGRVEGAGLATDPGGPVRFVPTVTAGLGAAAAF